MKFRNFLFYLIFLFLCSSLYGNIDLEIYPSPQETLGYGKCTFSEVKTSYYHKKAPLVYELEFKLQDKLKLNPLYPVFDHNSKTCTFRYVQSQKRQDFFQNKENKIKEINITNLNNYYPNHMANQKDQKVTINSTDLKAIKEEWEKGFEKTLKESIKENEDHELELLLYLRFFDKLPSVKSKRFKTNPFFKFLYSISGLSDIQDAIPFTKNDKPSLEKYTEAPPEPIMLPLVETPPQSTAIESLANYVPRSCYYLSWNNEATFLKSLDFFSKQFDDWSKGTYPMSASYLIDFHLKRIGLSKTFIKENWKDKIEQIALSGWDPYFQSGTNFMLLIKSKEKINIPETKYSKQISDHVTLLSTCERLIKMSESGKAKGKDLSSQNNYIYSRDKVKATKDEMFFLYLSDFWLTNFISPRWKILNDRLNQTAARIKLTFLLKTIYKQENKSTTLPDIPTLKASKLLNEKYSTWLFENLIDTPEGIKHKNYGSLYNFSPIDMMSFDQVSKKEFAHYEKFKNRYVRRWREMDPIAFQVLKTEKENNYKTKLYISPISNRSDFRQIQGFIPKAKVKHSFNTLEGLAFGVSIALPTPVLKNFGIQAELPLTLFIQAAIEDFAPSSYASGYWFEEIAKHDPVSFYRLPATLILPSIVFNSMFPMIGNLEQVPSKYEGINYVPLGFNRETSFPLMVLNDDNNAKSYFSFNPSTLKTIQKTKRNDIITDETPCDVRLFINFQEGYMLQRKLWFEAVKNRAIASWRRQNRIFRIQRQLGLTENEVKNLKQSIQKESIFPLEDMINSRLTRRMPKLKEASPIKRWGGDTEKSFEELPSLVRAVEKVDSYISLEQNGLFFENDIEVDQNYFQEEELPGNPFIPNSSQPAQTTQLDFDDN